jgi:hypothetical protein
MAADRNRRQGLYSVALAALAATMLAACHTSGASTGTATLTPSAPAIVITQADLPGKWGVASYRKEEDLERTTAEAKRACGNPYKIDPGPNGGAMMYLADQSTPSELFLKTDSQGRVFIGPNGPPAVQQDRMIQSYENGTLVTDWLDPNTRERYGTMVFVRCGKA